MNVKEEPVSSTNEQQNEENSETVNDNVVARQPPSTTVDFENDPEAGPSGLQTESVRNGMTNGHRMLRYHSDSDDDSGDECANATMWHRFNRNEEDSGDTRFSTQSWGYDTQPIVNEVSLADAVPSASNNQSEEIIDLSENESIQSNAPLNDAPTNANRNIEVLTAPDLQLDWLSDSSSDNEIVCAIRPQTPNRSAAIDLSQSNLNTIQTNNVLPLAIDLTASDEEENTRENNYLQSNAASRMNLYREYFRDQRISDLYNGRLRRSLRSPNFRIESRNDRTSASRNQGETPSNGSNGLLDNSTIRNELLQRRQNLISSRSRNDSQWYRPVNLNGTSYTDATAGATAPPSAPNNTVFIQQDTRPTVNIEQRPRPISPQVIMYEPFANVQPASDINPSNIRGENTTNESVPFSAPNNSANGTQPTRHPSGTRCPHYRRMFHNLQNHYHSSLQNGNAYWRPAYAPHESLWYRQQTNQEIHRRYMMNSMSGTGTSNDTTQPNSFGSYPSRVPTSMTNNGSCIQCDQQHPIGHPHRRIRQFVCGLNVVSSLGFF